ncbi:peptidoglycan recognition protein family protein [Streptomyces sp. NBC_01723]|uniref:peptidoglycan recognition protein family protein n=1 Tax=Streptomyces sp. NBC_01723 TaxID=2975921 RepID=UPI002E3438EC|nr:peptidoglycan recognition family protein [Streptomyces sp. NBC_01723]
MKLVTRAQLGWPASAAPTQTSTKGVKVHYEGAPVSTKLLSDHNACIAEWKNIRKSHLANTAEGYSDVAYNYAACPHGYLLEGRGLRKRTGANGNQTLNQGHYAIVGLVGSEGLTQPTDAMLSAIRDGIELLRKNGAGTEIKGHRDGYATACPGGPLYAWVQKGAPRPTVSSDKPPAQEDDVPHAIGRYDSTDRTLVPRKWTTLSIDGADLLTGASHYQAMANVQAVLPPGSTLQGRFYHLRKDNSRWSGPLIERIGTDGSTFADFHNSGSVVDSERVRFEVIYYPAKSDDQKSVTITAAYCRGLYWK